LKRPGLLLLVLFALVAALGAGLRGVVKDSSVDAFLPLDHPAAVAREEAKAVFGLEDPIVIALAAPPGGTVFTAEGLQALRAIHEAVRVVPGVKKNDVISLASENAIAGREGDLLVDPILPRGAISEAAAADAWARVQAMPMYLSLLASETGDLVTILAPVEDPNHAQAVVTAVKEIAAAHTPAGVSLHVAGVATMNARLSEIVDGDTRIFIPAAVLTVLAILFLALRRFSALIGPLVVIAGSAAAAIGLMGWLDARYYLITTALPVIIMAIAVADSLHITAFYMRARAADPGLSACEAAAFAVRHTFLPVTLTSVTTIAGFVGLSSGAAMKPISEFGLFAAFGVAVAWVLSLTALPAILVLKNLQPRAEEIRTHETSWLDRAAGRMSSLSFSRPGLALAVLACVTLACGLAATQAKFDYARKNYFVTGDPVRTADALLNERLGGVNFLDVVVTAPAPGGLMTPQALNAIADLRAEIAALDHVSHVRGIDQSIAVMHQALTGAAANVMPTAQGAPAQYMFLYEAGGAPEDFRQEIDYDHQRALIRAQLDSDRYSDTLPTVDRLRELASAWSARSGLEAVVSGRVAVNDGWMTLLAQNHFYGLGLALALVCLTTIIAFRNLTYALIAMLPVMTGVLFVYAIMGLFSIDIAPATAMTAAIASGLGVDFGIHLIAHLRRRRVLGVQGVELLDNEYQVVARACFYSALALSVALAVICLSSAPPLRWFGVLVSAGAVGSLLGAVTLVPAFAALAGRTWRIGGRAKHQNQATA
jgi:hypothetical protein